MTIKRSFLIVCLSIIFTFAVTLYSTIALGAIIHVPADQPTIQAGIDAASPGDTVQVAAGTYYENITMKSGVVIQGAGAGDDPLIHSIIDGGDLDSVVTAMGVNSAAKLDGFMITNGNAMYGGGIKCDNSSPIITNCTISGNSVSGIRCDFNSAPTITNCTISNNTAGGGDGIACYGSSPTITNCTISGNSGSGIMFGENSSATITNCSITDNIGAGINLGQSSSPTITDCTISGNSGWGIGCNNSSATITNCTIAGNGGIGINCGQSSSPPITNCIITGNGESGIFCSDNSSPTITNSTITGNSGSGISGWRNSCLTITDSEIAGNSGSGIGFVDIDSCSPTITDCSITGNGHRGIRFVNSTSASITNCAITGNTTDWGGAGIEFVNSSPTVTNCIISNNTATSNGGGIRCRLNSSPTITNCTISNNTASGGGGAIYINDNSSPTIRNSILWADAPEEISVETGTITVTYSDIQGGWEGTGNINDDPLFVGAGDYHLTAGSPSIDAGTSDGAPAIDIEGTTRPQGNGYDMGAYEEFIIPGDIDYSENIDLRDAILALQVCIGIAPTSAIHKEADVNGDNKIGIAEAIYALQISADLYRHPTVSLDDQNSSYMLQKTSLHIDRQGIRQTNPGTFVHAIAYADFDNDGDEDVFMSSGGGINPTPVEMYLNDGEGNFTLDLTIFQGEVPNLVHPRKALVSDFNGDGLPDVFVIGHGYDQPPWPGEHPVLILSSPTGLQNVGGLENYVGFQHGGASADIDADGDVDIFVADTNQPFFLMNVGSGSFTYDTQRLPGELTGRPLFTAELIDVDMDGYFDLLVAGHEHEGMQTTIYWGSNTWTYTASNKTILPIVTGQGTVLDIDAEDLDNDGDRDIVITRTGGGQGNFYVGYYIQIIVNAGGRQFADETGQRIANGTGANWIDWIRLQDWNNDNHLDIVVDDYSRNLIWFNNGAGSF